MNGACSKYKGRDMYRFWWANLRERDYLYDVGADGRIIIQMVLQRVGFGTWTEIVCFGTSTSVVCF
jgi:hypothetical protein